MARADATTGEMAGNLASPHPNEVDCKRIERLLSQRHRYRYVSPEVIAVEGGYLIKSPCCSRNVDKSGGMIDIALLEYDCLQQGWCLHRMEHKQGQWVLYGKFKMLAEVLKQLNQDPQRIFWP